MSKTIDEGLAGALVKLAGKALKSQSVRQSARTGALGAGLAATWKNTFGGSNTPKQPSNTKTKASSYIPGSASSNDDFDNFNFDKYAKHAAAFESGGRKYGNANYGSKTNFGYEGAFGTGSQALEQAGLLKPGATKKYRNNNSSQAAIYQPDAWADGYSREQYLKSPELQHKVYRTITKFNYDALKNKGVIKPGMSQDEIAGRLYAAAHGGAGGAEKYFVHGKDTRDFKFKDASVGKSYASMKQHYRTYGNDDPDVDPNRKAVAAKRNQQQPGIVDRALTAARNVFKEETSQKYATKTDIINKTIDRYVAEATPAPQMTIEESLIASIEHLPEAHAITLLRLFNDLSEDNQITMIGLVQSESGVRELLDFAIDKYVVQKN